MTRGCCDVLSKASDVLFNGYVIFVISWSECLVLVWAASCSLN